MESNENPGSVGGIRNGYYVKAAPGLFPAIGAQLLEVLTGPQAPQNPYYRQGTLPPSCSSSTGSGRSSTARPP